MVVMMDEWGAAAAVRWTTAAGTTTVKEGGR